MRASQPSLTALGAAGHRAAHQILERGSILSDPLALRILGADAEVQVQKARSDQSLRRLRIFIAARSRVAEDATTAALRQGVTQAVLLGAGLDTFPYRTAGPAGLRMFEVDHPATQAWKCQRLQAAGIDAPAHLVFVPVDFERETLAVALATAGFDCRRPATFSWLGVVPYLRRESVWSTLRFIGGLPGGAQVIFDYANPPASVPAAARAAHTRLAARVAAAGERFRSYFDTDSLEAQLRACGFAEIEDLGPAAIAARFLGRPSGARGERGGHILRAATVAGMFSA
jgi:methyltransferase (TIGR00027 family)